MSKHPVFSDATVNAVQKFVLDKFPSNTSSGKSRNSAKRSQSSYEYGILEERGYLKANESQAGSALADPNSTTKGSENNLYTRTFNFT